MREAIANQGEIRVDRISEIPGVSVKPFSDRTAKGWIISHSEQGHHHILGGDCEVMERVDAPTGAKILYAIVCGVPSGPVALKSLGKTAALLDRPVANVEQLGTTAPLKWIPSDDALTITPASAKPASDAGITFKITLK